MCVCGEPVFGCCVHPGSSADLPASLELFVLIGGSCQACGRSSAALCVPAVQSMPLSNRRGGSCQAHCIAPGAFSEVL
jgi:hypothetical protein